MMEVQPLRWLAWVTWLGFSVLQAEGDELWRIGTRDESSAEFHPWIHPTTGERQIDYSDPRSDAVYRVGTSDPAKDWPAYQPGSANGGAGFREHPARIEFQLGEAPRGDLELRLDLLAYSARLPVVQVDVNGRRTWWYQHPRLTTSAGDPAVFFQPHYSVAEVRCPLPGTWFRAGTNHLVVTAIDVPGDREDVRPSGFPWPGCSGLIYDALTLATANEAEGKRRDSAVELQVEPTVFFRERQGELREEVDVVVHFPGRVPKGLVRWEMNGRRVEGDLGAGGGREGGEGRVTLEVPVWEGSAEATIQVVENGRTWDFRRTVKAGRRWTLWMVPHEHLDVGYTDYDAKVAELHSRVVDDAMALSEQKPGFSFTLDGFWVVEQYRAGRSPVSLEQMIRAVREGRLHVPVVHGSLFTGSASLEGLIRNLYPSRRFSREHGTPFDVAIVTDVPSYSWSLASVLASAGVTYFVGASDAYRGPFLLWNSLNQLGPHAWEGPDGGRVTTWYARHYHQVSSLLGLPPRPSLARDALPRFLQAYDRPSYRANSVILYGSQVENVTLNQEQAGFPEVWHREYAFPQFRIGGFAEAMEDVTRQQGELPVVRGDGGPYWEDGLAANARVTALARENSRRLPSAEKMATLAMQWNPRYSVDAVDLESAWHASRLIDEHTWHADCSVRDPESDQARRQGDAKDARAFEAKRALERVLQRSLSAIADVVPASPGTLMVFNPLSWKRSGWVEVEVGRGQAIVDPATGRWVPMEVLREGRVYQRVRFVAPEVPAMGYRSLVLRPMPGKVKASSAQTSEAAVGPKTGTEFAGMPGPVLKSRHYKVTLDVARGGLSSLVELESGREWVDPHAAYALGQWLYVTGGDELPNRLVQYSTVSPVPDLAIHPTGSGRLTFAGREAWGEVARMETETLHCPRVETEVLLPDDRKEIRITVRVKKTASLSKEAAYVAFPWAIEAPRFRYATQNGYVDPTRDLLAGACQEWFAIQDWVGVEGSGGSVLLTPLDAPLVTFGDVVRGVWPREFGTRKAVVFSYVMSNYTPEGYAASQGGDFVFRYGITSRGRFEAGDAATWGAETMTPLETSEITRSDKGTGGRGMGGLDPVQGEGLRVEPDTVQVVAWKQAESGKGRVLRLLETSGNPTEVRVQRPGGTIVRATRCNAVEDDLGELEVDGNGNTLRVPLGGFGLATIRLEP